MKRYSYLLLFSFLFLFTSCLKSGLEDLPEFEENNITGVQRVEYRYISDEISGTSGQNIVKYVELSRNVKVDKDAKTVVITATVPAASTAFPESARNKCNKSNISVMISVSTAARVSPVGDAPKLGLPGDWSKPNKYIVTAANGDKKEWTIEVTDLVK